MVSYLVGYAMVAAGVVSAAGFALAFAGDYLATFLDVPRIPAAMIFLVLIGLVNARGITESLRSNLIMTVIEISGLLVVIIVAAIFVDGGDGDLGRVGQLPAGGDPGLVVLGGAIIAYYSFLGFETSANIAEEIRDPSRRYPRALFGALATAGIVYLGVRCAADDDHGQPDGVRDGRTAPAPGRARPGATEPEDAVGRDHGHHALRGGVDLDRQPGDPGLGRRALDPVRLPQHESGRC
ncbi:hypothetical protein BKA15_002905 [Microlunatus parietis]|uniref:Amino acid permease n=1 Tax=Microlunatus parietis TaxID=682979 RepID=A0A7Y9I775_9ACTN|nr:APC family permease [Microlunatus parietis]NYE71576.1 hypothetical protein [Microlunatus parietis]